jgi:signal transduction histidine kinase
MTTGLALPRGRGDTLLAQRFGAERRPRAVWALLWVLAAAATFGALAPVLFRHVPFEPIDVAFRIVGASFAACGLVAWRRRPDNRSGLLMTATGFALFATPLLAQVDAPLAQTLGLLLPDLWVLFFVPLVLTLLTGGRLRTPMDRVLVAAVLLDLVVLAPLWLMFAPEDGNLLLIVDDPRVAGIVDSLQLSLFVAVLIGASLVLGARWWAASAPGRRALLPGVAGATCLLLFAVLISIQLSTGVKSPVLLWIATCSLITVPVAFLAGLLRSRLARAGVADLFRDLRSIGPVELQTMLARVLGDPRLLLAFPDGEDLVDAAGHPVHLPAADAGQAVTPVDRDGEPVAVLIYDRSLEDDPELVETIGVAAAVALENRQLHAEVTARLAELQASRERIVTAADAERRRIERNLHDGAQQRLVTLALQLSLIQREIRRDPAEAEQLVSSASEELAHSLEELREFARGIHPAALEHGLDVALDALAQRAAVPTTVVFEDGPRLAEPVEFAAYFVASEALANVAKHAEASTVTIRLLRTGPDVVITITDDGVGGADPTRGTGLQGLTDRVEALGGRLEVGTPAEGGTVVTATLPLRAPRPGPTG